MNKNKIIFMGTPLIASKFLKILLNKNYNIVSVFSQPARKKNRGMEVEPSPVELLTKENNIAIHTPQKIDNEAYELIKSYNPDLVIVIAYGLIIPSHILNFPKFGFINVHFSLLPRWRGAAPVEHTLLSGDKKSGVSIIKLEENLDSGPILSQKEILVEESMNKEILFNKLTETGTNLLLEILPEIFFEKVSFEYQANDKATYANKITSEIRKINFNNSSFKVINQIRAFSPKPAAWFTYNKERIKIISALKKDKKGIPGTILNDKFELGLSDGCIAPIFLQREGKKIMHIDDFLRGFLFKVGNKLNE